MAARQWHREIFLIHNGPGPWPCHECGDGVYFESSFHVHHVDGDDANNDPANLAAMHPPCHTSITHRGKISPQRGVHRSREAIDKMRATLEIVYASKTHDELSDRARRGWETRRKNAA